MTRVEKRSEHQGDRMYSAMMPNTPHGILARFPELRGPYWNIYRGVLAVKPFDRSSLRFFLNFFVIFLFFVDGVCWREW